MNQGENLSLGVRVGAVTGTGEQRGCQLQLGGWGEAGGRIALALSFPEDNGLSSWFWKCLQMWPWEDHIMFVTRSFSAWEVMMWWMDLPLHSAADINVQGATSYRAGSPDASLHRAPLPHPLSRTSSTGSAAPQQGWNVWGAARAASLSRSCLPSSTPAGRNKWEEGSHSETPCLTSSGWLSLIQKNSVLPVIAM